jgi:hypothetical protein
MVRFKMADEWNGAQRKTVEETSPKGYHWDSGVPCTCGGDAIETTKSLGYSDFVTYTHTCSRCGNTFSTYIEG